MKRTPLASPSSGKVTASPAYTGQKIIYSLTEKGIDLLPLLVEIGAWSIKHKPVDLVKYKHAQDLVKGGKEMQAEIRKQLLKEHVG